MIVAVAEVVDVVSRDGVQSVLELPCVSALHVACEVGLECGGARVQNRHHISVVSPCVAEGHL